MFSSRLLGLQEFDGESTSPSQRRSRTKVAGQPSIAECWSLLTSQDGSRTIRKRFHSVATHAVVLLVLVGMNHHSDLAVDTQQDLTAHGMMDLPKEHQISRQGRGGQFTVSRDRRLIANTTGRFVAVLKGKGWSVEADVITMERVGFHVSVPQGGVCVLERTKPWSKGVLLEEQPCSSQNTSLPFVRSRNIFMEQIVKNGF
jgi:hypothetical protein